MTAHETAAIVDPFSTGADLAPEFRRRGWATVAVLSSPTLPELYEGSLRPADFDTVVTHEGDAALTAKRLADAGVAAVLPGTEIGVELADRLAAVLGRPGNGTPGSRARRNKAAMVDALTAAGLPAARTFLTGDAAAAVDWARRFDRWPVVVKPVDSAGADGVTFCDSPGEVREAFDRLHGTRNRMGQHNTQVLLQEMLLGQQYFINSVSRDGTHYIFEIWRDRRHRVAGAGMVCEREDLLPPNGATQDVIRDYVTKVLDALAIRWGAAHTELMLTDRGPVLIET